MLNCLIIRLTELLEPLILIKLKEDLTAIFDSKKKNNDLISIILPLYNEEDSLNFVLNEIFVYLPKEHSNYRFEITFVDDCSTDSSYNKVLEYSVNTPNNIKISILQLSKNSGSHIAITAGLNKSRGDLTILMASDGQDPIEIVSKFISEWEKGNELVIASRSYNQGKSLFSNFLSKIAWKIMKWSTKIDIPEKGCDLLGMDRKVLNAFNNMDERNTTFIFRIFSLGFDKKEIQYVKRSRFAGSSKWTFLKKTSIMLDAISGFSNRPLKLITNLGLIIFILLMIRWGYIVFRVYFLKETPSDLTIILNTIFTSLALIIFTLGVIGNYIWRILDETRKRPVYEIKKFDGEIFKLNQKNN